MASNSKLDGSVVLGRAFDQDADRIRVDAEVSATIGTVAVVIDAAGGDNVAISDGVDTLVINPDGSINVVNTSGLTDAQLRASPVPISGTVTANLGTIAGVATSAKQDLLLAELQLKADLTETQPISAASLPLPSGAATSALQSTQDTSINTLLKPASTLAAVTLVSTVSAVTAITNALPAGTNNIGDVDVLSLPAIPAGNNNIGDVDIASIAAGDNNIGNVDIVTMPAITGTVTANAGTNLNTSALALSATQTDGTQKSIARGGAKGSTTAADITSTSQSADRNAMDVQIRTSAGAVVDSFGGGTQYTEDVAAAADPVGTTPILVRKDTPAAITTTDGDNIAQRATNYGAAYVQVVSSAGAFVDTFGGGTQYADGAVRGTSTGTLMMGDDGTNIQSVKVDAAGELQIDVLSSALPSGASTSALQSTIDTSINTLLKPASSLAQVTLVPTVTTVSTVTNLSQMSGAAIAMGTGVRSAGTQRVTVATDDVVPISAASLPLPSGAATSALQSTQDTSINTLLKPANTLAGVTTVSTVTNLSQLGGAAVSMNTGVRDAGTQRVTIATNDSVPVTGTVTANAGTNLNTSALNLEATQSAMSAKLPATLGQKTMANALAVSLASDQSSIPVAATLAAETTKVIGTINISAAQSVIANPSDYKSIIDEASGTVTYVGRAVGGTATSAASWQVSKYTLTGAVLAQTTADGDFLFNNIWDNRAALSYS